MMPTLVHVAIDTVIGAALRSLVLALAVWLGLSLFRVRNVLALKSAWTLVLAAAFVMPLALPISAHLPRLAVVVPMLARTPAPAAQVATPEAQVLSQQARTASQMASPAMGPLADGDSRSNIATRIPAPVDSNADGVEAGPAATAPLSSSPATRPSLTLFDIAISFYLAVTALLLFRLMYGLTAALRLWRAAEPVSVSSDVFEGLRLRASDEVSSPVTVGSGVVLPADYSAWDEEKLRIVLAHERSHIQQGDFYLQALAGLYAAVVWFSPLGWWVKRKLSELGEAISDRSGLEEAASRSSYAQILLEFAVSARPTPIGVAMARPSNLSHRFERLFNERTFRQAFAARRRTFAIAVLVPLAMFAATTLVRVEAATQAAQQAAPGSSATRVTRQAQTDAAQAQPSLAPEVAPDVIAAPQDVQAPPQAEPAPAPNAAPAPPAAPMHVEVPPIHVNVPAVHVNVPAQHFDVPAVHVDVPAKHIDIPAQHFDVPAQHFDVPAQHFDVPAQHIDIPAIHVDVPAVHIEAPSKDEKKGSGQHSFYATSPGGGELVAMLNGVEHVFGGHAAVERTNSGETEATFDRTLSFGGKLDLHVLTGSGNIHFTRGSAGQLVVHARVHSNDPDEAQEVQSIAANPPIEQTGNVIRIGKAQHEEGMQEGMHHISIDYEIEAPADAGLEALSGSGNVKDEGVGDGAKLMTGSGNIVATGIHGAFAVQTGSGNITIDSTDAGDAKAETGSGNIEVNGVTGGLKAETGSGDIKATGTPSAPWKLETGSGNVDITPGDAALTLDASAGSGSVTSDRALTAQVSSDRHHLHAELNGGGPEVRVETGSGDIRLH